LARAVAGLARSLSWQETARFFRLDGKSVASIVHRVVAHGLERRRRQPLHILGIDEVSRRKGHHYLTVVYDLERGLLLWVGEDRTEETLSRFFRQLGRRRSATIRVVCLDMWQAYLKAVRNHAPNAQVLFDRFHLVQHRNRALDEVRRNEMRRLSGREKACFKKTRFLLLKNPWKLRTEEKERLSTWFAGIHPSCALTTSRKLSSSSGPTVSPAGPSSICNAGCTRPCAPDSNRSKNWFAGCGPISTASCLGLDCESPMARSKE
jgi:transposase